MKQFQNQLIPLTNYPCIYCHCDSEFKTAQELRHHIDQDHDQPANENVKILLDKCKDHNNAREIMIQTQVSSDLYLNYEGYETRIKAEYKIYYAVDFILNFLEKHDRKNWEQRKGGGGAFRKRKLRSNFGNIVKGTDYEFWYYRLAYWSLFDVVKNFRKLQLDSRSVFADLTSRLGDIVYIVALYENIPCIALESYDIRHQHALQAFKQIKKIFKDDADISQRLSQIDFQFNNMRRINDIIHQNGFQATHVFIGEESMNSGPLERVGDIMKKSLKLQALTWTYNPSKTSQTLSNVFYHKPELDHFAIYLDQNFSRDLYSYQSMDLLSSQIRTHHIIEIDKSKIEENDIVDINDKLIDCVIKKIIDHQKQFEELEDQGNIEEEKSSILGVRAPQLIQQSSAYKEDGVLDSKSKRLKIAQDKDAEYLINNSDQKLPPEPLSGYIRKLKQNSFQFQRECSQLLNLIKKPNLQKDFVIPEMQKFSDIHLNLGQIETMISEHLPQSQFINATKQEQREYIVHFNFYLQMQEQKDRLVKQAIQDDNINNYQLNSVLLQKQQQIFDYEKVIHNQAINGLIAKNIAVNKLVWQSDHSSVFECQMINSIKAAAKGLKDQQYLIQIPKQSNLERLFQMLNEVRSEVYKSTLQYNCKPIKMIKCLGLNMILYDHYSQTLSNYFEQNTLNDLQRAKIMIGLIKGLAFHKQHQCHLNLSPECIFINDQYEPRIIGYASQDILCGGKRGYQPPEQFIISNVIDQHIKVDQQKVDAYALGIILYQLFYKELPYSDKQLKKMETTGKQPQLPLNIMKPTNSLDQIIQKLLRENPKERIIIEEVEATQEYGDIKKMYKL